jgi:anti-sigma B factor antagonist
VQSEQRSLQLLLWTAAQRPRALASGPNARSERTQSSKARSTTLAPGAARFPRPLQDGRPPSDRELVLRSVRSGLDATVAVSGELDCASAPLLAEELRKLLAEGSSRITVDLAETTFIDSTGLVTLISALTAAREGGGDIVLHAPRRCVRKVLAISGADRFFQVT